MTPEQITEMRVAIAEKCGFEPSRKGDWWNTPNGNQVFESELPNYPADLNAMHEAEKVMTYEQAENYEDSLVGICGGDVSSNLRGQFFIFHATALQRAEAFCRTLKIGPFKE